MSGERLTIIVGSGPAGVSVATELLAAGERVLLLESGVAREREVDRELNQGAPPWGVWGHEPLAENRRRVLGGTSTAWGGRCVPLDPIDFEARDWIPDSGWPIDHAEYARFLPAAARLLEIPETSFSAPVNDPLLAAVGDIDGSPIELWSPPTDMGRQLTRLRRTNSQLEVMDASTVVGIDVGADGAVAGLLVHRVGATTRLVGDRYVLAAGTLENTRLLLAAGIGHRLPALGRYYMSHVFATHVAYRGRPLPSATGFFRIGATYARHRWQLTADAQRRLRVGNVIGFIGRPPAHRVAVHLDPLSALVGAAKLARRHASSPRSLLAQRAQFRVYARVLAGAPPTFWPHVALQSLRRRARHRLPMLLPSRAASQHHLTVQAEHLPHPESRLRLSDQRDLHGLPLLVADIDFHRADFETVEAFHGAMERRFAESGYTGDRTPEMSVRDLVRDMAGGFNSNAHHIGTARMGTDPRTSVVDSDCRVHGVANLWVAGAAVFPTSGHANPTLSIVALGCRLGAHLAH